MTSHRWDEEKQTYRLSSLRGLPDWMHKFFDRCGKPKQSKPQHTPPCHVEPLAIFIYKFDEIEVRHLRLVNLWDVSPDITIVESQLIIPVRHDKTQVAWKFLY